MAKLSLTENEVDVLYTNVLKLVNYGQTSLSFDPVNKAIFEGKSEKEILKDIERKLDKIRT